MNLNLANQLVWGGGIISAIIGLIVMISYMTGKGEQAPSDSEESKCQKSFLGSTWSIFLIFAIIIFIFIGLSPAKKGTRGALVSVLVGCFIPLFLASMESIALKKWQENKSILLIQHSSLSVGGIGISLLYMGFVSVFYGIKAVNLWISFIIGVAIGLYLIRLMANLVKYPRYDGVASRIEVVMLLIIATIISTIMAGYHFTHNITYAYFPIIMLMALYMVTLICSAPFVRKKDTNIINTISLQIVIFLILFLGFIIFLVHKLHIKVDYTYPIICGAVSSVIFIVMLHSSASTIKGVDLSNGAFGILLLLGGIWSSYKWGLGFGMTLYSMGLLSIGTIIVPHCSLESRVIDKDRKPDEDPLKPSEKDMLLEGDKTENSSKKSNKKNEKSDKITNIYNPVLDSKLTWPRLFTRGIGLAGLAAVLMGMFRIIIQSTPLLSYGIDISTGDVSIAFLLGIFIPLFFEGFNLSGPGIFFADKREGFTGGLWRFLASLFILSTALFSVGMLFKLEGLGAFLLGLAIPSLLGVFAFFSQKICRGIFRASNMALWIAAPALTFFLVNFKDIPDKLTRANKQQIVFFLIILVILVFLLTHFFNKKRKPAH